MSEQSDSRRKKRRAPIKRDFDPARWAHVIFFVLGAAAAWVLTNATTDIWEIVWEYYPQIGRSRDITSSAIGIGIALIATIYCWRRKDYFKFCTEVVTEISQVTWPTKAEIRANTGIVIMVTLICSVILFAMDQLWSSATNLLYGI
ncbi:MAG: preprotein translocase subunit SecE [Myxococcota bacterium]